MLKWMLERIEGNGKARPSPIGFLPTDDALDVNGLAGATPERVHQLLDVDTGAWKEEAERNAAFLAKFGDRLPTQLRREHEDLVRRLSEA